MLKRYLYKGYKSLFLKKDISNKGGKQQGKQGKKNEQFHPRRTILILGVRFGTTHAPQCYSETSWFYAARVTITTRMRMTTTVAATAMVAMVAAAMMITVTTKRMEKRKRGVKSEAMKGQRGIRLNPSEAQETS